MKPANANYPQYWTLFKENDACFKEKVLHTVANLVVFMDPAPTTFVKKTKNVHRCTNCGYEWTE